MPYIKIILNITILTICYTISYGQEFGTSQFTEDFDWDYLIFSQRWPLTTCTEWEQTKSGNTCNLPINKSVWTIHGIWPTKTGTNGPLFCKSAIHFNPDELTPMLDELKQQWINIEANTKPNSFWSHEWTKHGTCASILPQFDSVTNYFRMGLKFNLEYKLSTILEKGGVVPSTNGYDISIIYNAIKKGINKEPVVHCIVDKKTKESFISEIRICFNKTLDLIDCNPPASIHQARDGLNTNCNLKKEIQYIPSIPTSSIHEIEQDIDQSYENFQRYTSLYNFINILLWITL